MPLRIAKWIDCFGIRTVSNECRMESFTPHRIRLFEHIKWFFKFMKNKLGTMAVYRRKGKVIAYAREVLGTVSVGVKKEYRGQGYGRAVLNFMIMKTGKQYMEAYIKPDNAPSVALFKACGFKFKKKTGEYLVYSYKL